MKCSYVKTIAVAQTLLLCFASFLVSAKEYTLNNAINEHNLVILQYHHVSSNTPNSTSVTPETFEKHMQFLSKNYKVIDLAEALKKIQSNQVLPDKSVAITFDDGYTNILANGHPILKKYNFPYTVFINPAIIGESQVQLTWEQIKGMQPLASFANHTLDHAHLLTKKENEGEAKWLKRVMSDVNQAEKIISEKLGYSRKWLAYPFGEFNHALKEELLEQGYIGFGQQSGAVANYSDFGALPRFPAAGVYANLDSLENKLNSFAMPVTSIKPNNNEFSLLDSLDFIEMQVEGNDVRLTSITCYFQGATLPIEQSGKTVTVTLNHKLKAGRARVNCTAPSKAHNGRFYWYSFPMFTATKEGHFLD